MYGIIHVEKRFQTKSEIMDLFEITDPYNIVDSNYQEYKVKNSITYKYLKNNTLYMYKFDYKIIDLSNLFPYASLNSLVSLSLLFIGIFLKIQINKCIAYVS
jgi:hypothetical protein